MSLFAVAVGSPILHVCTHMVLVMHFTGLFEVFAQMENTCKSSTGTQTDDWLSLHR